MSDTPMDQSAEQSNVTKPVENPVQGFPPPTVAPAPNWQQEPPKKRAGFWRGFGQGTGFGLGLTVMVVAVTFISGIFSLIALGMSLGALTNASGASMMTTTVWGEDGSGGRLRAISINGVIMTQNTGSGLFSQGTYGYEIADMLDSLGKDDADGVVLLVDTPGGSIVGSSAISSAIERYQERTGHKVFVHVGGMSASGGVYSTAPADKIIADHGSLVGSVGVIFGPIWHYNKVTATGSTLIQQGVVTEGGIEMEYLTRGKGKDIGNPYREMTAEERARFDAILDYEYMQFVKHVSTNRGIPESTLIDDMGAAIFAGEDAKRYGLIDDVMNRDEFFRYAATEAGLDPDKTIVEEIEEPSGMLSQLGITRKAGQALPLVAGEGVMLVDQDICGGAHPLAFAGDLQAVCGG